MIFRRVVPLFLSALSPLAAANFPVVPRSERVLSEEDVKDFWITRLRSMPFPPPASGELEGESERERELARRKALTREIREGLHDVAARLVSLSHNVEVWSRRGDEHAAARTEATLVRLRERLARLAELEARRDHTHLPEDDGGRALTREIERLQSAIRQEEEMV